MIFQSSASDSIRLIKLFKIRVMVRNPIKIQNQSGGIHQSVLSVKNKLSSNQTYKPSEDNQNILPLHVPGNDMKQCKVMQSQDKQIKATWQSSCEGGGRSKFKRAKKRSDGGEDMNTIVIYTVVQIIIVTVQENSCSIHRFCRSTCPYPIHDCQSLLNNHNFSVWML